jgi:hypothetical protein
MSDRRIIPLLVFAALAAPALARADAGYVLKAQQANVAVAKVQFAILHALLGWKGGSNPSFSYYKAEDLQVLQKAGVSVQELTDQSQRATLEIELGNVRHDYNNGVKNVYNKSTHITADKMVQRHKALIDKYADHVTGWTGTAAGETADATAAYRIEDGKVTALIAPLNAMAQAKTDADFDAALAQFNAVAAGFDNGYQLSRAAGESYDAVRSRGLAIYEKERQFAIALGSKLNNPALNDSLEALKNKTGVMFDAATASGKLPAGPGSFNSSTDPNDAAARMGGAGLSADVPKSNPPKPQAKAGGKEQPGLFGMLGSLLGGLFRTIGRVIKAAVGGLIGVGKAIFS